MNYMKDIMFEIKDRPTLYIYESTLENLCSFINGYMYRIFENKDEIPEFCSGFQKYIESLYNISTGQHWSKILRLISINEKDAVEKFFEIYVEFSNALEQGVML